MKNESKNKLMNAAINVGIVIAFCLVFYAFFKIAFGKMLESPASDPCSSTFLILDGQNRAILTFTDCEDGGTIEVDAQVPCFDSNTVNRILQTARKSNEPGQTNSVWVQHDKHVLCITRNGSRKELTDTIVSIIQKFKAR